MKKARRDVAVRMARKKVKQYVGDCDRMARKYGEMARAALSLGDRASCDHYLCRKVQHDTEANRWRRFLLKMEEMMMVGQASGAMTALIDGVRALNVNIRAGVSEKQIVRAANEFSVTLAQAEQAQEQLTCMLDTLPLDVPAQAEEAESFDIPDELRGEVERLRSELLDAPAAEPVAVAAGGGAPASDTDARIEQGLARLRSMK